MTSKTIACPQCRASVSPTASTCPQCGVQLALAAVLAGQSITPSRTELEKTRISPEVLVPRLGDYLIEKGFLTLADLEKALIYQKEKQAGGETILIGQVLQELGFISREELDQAVTEQIVKLQTALQKTNQDLESRVKERTAELEYAMSRLAELDPLKANFLANISHELRTPLTHLRGYIQLLADEQLGPLTPSQSNALEVMQKSESKLGNLIDDLIQFSILERSNLSLQLHKVDLLAIFKEIIPAIKAKCRENDLHCKVGIHRETPPVRADAEKLTWAL